MLGVSAGRARAGDDLIAHRRVRAIAPRGSRRPPRARTVRSRDRRRRFAATTMARRERIRPAERPPATAARSCAGAVPSSAVIEARIRARCSSGQSARRSRSIAGATGGARATTRPRRLSELSQVLAAAIEIACRDQRPSREQEASLQDVAPGSARSARSASVSWRRWLPLAGLRGWLRRRTRCSAASCWCGR